MSESSPAASPSPASIPAPTFLEKSGNVFFRLRDGLFPVVVAALLFATDPVSPRGSRALDNRLDVVGILVCLAGQSLRIAVIGYAYIIRGGKGRKVYAEDLVTGGFFALCRNPLYVGNLLVLFGLFIIWNSPWIYLVGVPFFLFGYRAIVAAEERFLRGKFGPAYEEYCADVNRWVPDLRRLRPSLEGMAFNWKRVLLKEYGSTTAWMGAAMILMVAERLHDGTFEQHATFIRSTGVAMGVLLACYGFTRWLKLTRRLRA